MARKSLNRENHKSRDCLITIFTHRVNKDKCSGKRRQKVHIEYDLVGYIPVDELLKAEQA